MSASEQDRPNIARRRREWRRRQASIDPRRFIFIDETWAKTNMAPFRGWSLRGTPLEDQVPHGRWRTQTLLAALRHDRITASFRLYGPINGQAFLIYGERVLALTRNPGDIVVMDNLGSYKSKAVRDAIRSAGAHRFFLPAYSPDLNPIEQRFSKLQALLCKARARAFSDISDRLRDLLGAFSPTEYTNYLINSGYARFKFNRY